MLNFCDFIQVNIFTTNHHLNRMHAIFMLYFQYHVCCNLPTTHYFSYYETNKRISKGIPLLLYKAFNFEDIASSENLWFYFLKINLFSVFSARSMF